MGKERVKKNPRLKHWIKTTVLLAKILGIERGIDLVCL